MANNRIQIKRSATTATPTSLLPGELAFSNVTGGSGVLFIGDTSNTAVVAIGGVRNPGTLTANQALVANSTSGINQVIVGNLAFTGATQNILANGSVGTAGFVLASGGTGSNLYWISTGSFSINVAAQYVWTNTHTFQNTVTFGANLVVDTTSLRWVGNTTTSPTVTFANSGAFTIGNSSTTQTTGQILVQNTAGLTTINAGSIQTTTVFANVSGTTGTFTGLVNASSLNVVNQTNTATLFVTTSANVGTAFTVTSSQVTTAVNTSLSGTLTTNTTVINGSVYVNATGFSTTGNANAGTVYVTGSVNATTVNTTSLYATGLVNAANFSTTGNANAGTIYVTGSVNATTVNTTSLYATGLVNAANFTTTGTVNTGTVYATGLVNASGFSTTGNANAANHYAGANALFSATSLAWTGNTTTSPTITLANTGSFTIGNSFTTQTTGQILVQNTAGLTTINAGSIQTTSVFANVSGTTGTFTGLVNATGFSTTGNANATNFFAGANLVVNSTNIVWTGNTTTSPTITLANTGAFTIGNSATTQTTSIITVANSTGNVVIGSGTASINATGSVNASSLRVSTNFIANTTQLTISGTPVSANGGVGSQGQALLSNGATGSPYWGSVGTITGVTAGSGLTGGGSSGSVTVDVGAGNGIAVAADTVAVKVGTNLIFDGNANVATASNVTFSNVVTTDISVTGNTLLGDATSDVVSFTARVNTAIVPASNQAYDLGDNLLRWNNIYANTVTTTGFATFGGNVSIGGTLTVTGNVITTNVQSVIVSDPMIYLAGNNYTSDILDIGFAANYNDGTTNRHTGLFRDHDDKIWKLFTNLTQELSGNNDVDILDASYRTATLQAYLTSSGLTTNAGSVYVTANSTVNVNISANVLTLSGRANNDLLFTNSTGGITGLALNTIGGYILQTNGTAIVYDYLDGGTF